MPVANALPANVQKLVPLPVHWTFWRPLAIVRPRLCRQGLCKVDRRTWSCSGPLWSLRPCELLDHFGLCENIEFIYIFWNFLAYFGHVGSGGCKCTPAMEIRLVSPCDILCCSCLPAGLIGAVPLRYGWKCGAPGERVRTCGICWEVAAVAAGTFVHEGDQFPYGTPALPIGCWTIWCTFGREPPARFQFVVSGWGPSGESLEPQEESLLCGVP